MKISPPKLTDPPTPPEKGFLFETWFINEVIRINDYHEKDFRISLWRKGEWEIDLLLERGSRPLLGIGIKTGRSFKESPSWSEFKEAFPATPLLIASLDDERARKTGSGFDVLPYRQALKRVLDA